MSEVTPDYINPYYLCLLFRPSLRVLFSQILETLSFTNSLKLFVVTPFKVEASVCYNLPNAQNLWYNLLFGQGERAGPKSNGPTTIGNFKIARLST